MHFFGYYKFWDPQENFYYCQKSTNFQVNPNRTEGTYSKYATNMLTISILSNVYWNLVLKSHK